MKDDQLKQIFKQARSEPTPGPSTDFDDDVMHAIRREPQGRGGRVSVFDELGHLFPRLAWVAALLIVVSVVADFGLRSSGGPDVDEGVAQVSAHWLFTAEGF